MGAAVLSAGLNAGFVVGVGEYERAVGLAGRVAPDGEDVAWIVADLAPVLSGVPVLRIDTAVIRVGPAGADGVAGVGVTVLVDGVEQARRVGQMLDLHPEYDDQDNEQGDGQDGQPQGWAWVRVAWRGWLHSVSRRHPVSVEVVALTARVVCDPAC